MNQKQLEEALPGGTNYRLLVLLFSTQGASVPLCCAHQTHWVGCRLGKAAGVEEPPAWLFLDDFCWRSRDVSKNSHHFWRCQDLQDTSKLCFKKYVSCQSKSFIVNLTTNLGLPKVFKRRSHKFPHVIRWTCALFGHHPSYPQLLMLYFSRRTRQLQLSITFWHLCHSGLSST